MTLPKLFIGSSTEGLTLAQGLRVGLSHDYDAHLWTEGIFRPSSIPIVDLAEATSKFEVAVFVFTPDDLVESRDKVSFAVRDNVLFELGLFMGLLGLQRTFFVVPRGEKDLHLPSDLHGVQPLEYIFDRGAHPTHMMGNAISELSMRKAAILATPKAYTRL
ncbi:TIR domain-containing protein [Tumebacillus flagellatus]|uniref:CD-NTase-associated protein 12/Pycsar effector protein TIR domain-containing protein n=1 Tax=Tumebacillus flagellatus TaxID=1157490 RepID=A0A074LRM8_9BACL|nr:TIR domain-containing protein [Tumebacillus flagellatus]KEO83110.1 hypothetical protein EL26_11620 [Tumebacillus flagellatus]